MNEQLYNVGQVINTHGIKGEVKVRRITDFDERFQPGQLLYWVSDEQEHDPQELVVKTHRMHKGFDLISFEDHASINEVEKYRDGFLKVPESDQRPLAEHEFYFHEIIGCKVYLITGEELGEVKEILTPGANDVWVVKRQQQKEILIPYIEKIVKDVNVEEQTVIIDPIEGLLD
ncbi:ribosome maturation factor RimM [Halobacillus hunanensis]|uniref:ribosome maturation factor RimM n=1 Tax=Halobacillus hunanensis TaxID=578214 RepID=UPI0009A5BC54|nr:ribosome maturation factor RimM [Halobacillus hunanensis]